MWYFWIPKSKDFEGLSKNDAEHLHQLFTLFFIKTVLKKCDGS